MVLITFYPRLHITPRVELFIPWLFIYLPPSFRRNIWVDLVSAYGLRGKKQPVCFFYTDFKLYEVLRESEVFET